MVKIKDATYWAQQIHKGDTNSAELLTLAEKKIEAVVFTGPPSSVHSIGIYVKRKNPSLRIIQDYRDPWNTDRDYSAEVIGKRLKKRGKNTKKAAKRLKKRRNGQIICADSITTTSRAFWRKSWRKDSPVRSAAACIIRIAQP